MLIKDKVYRYDFLLVYIYLKNYNWLCCGEKGSCDYFFCIVEENSYGL